MFKKSHQEKIKCMIVIFNKNLINPFFQLVFININ